MAAANEPDGTTPTTDPAREFLEFWKNYFEQTAIQTRVLLEGMQGGKSLDQMRNQWLGSLSESLDQFMRTPAFLDVLKQTLKRMVDLKLLQDQMAQAAVQQTGTAQAADVAGVHERVRGVEQALLARLDSLDDRLRAIEARLPAGPAERNSG